MTELDRILVEVHGCPSGLTCRPGRGVLYPACPRGRVPTGGRPDVLLVGWNPRTSEFDQVALPEYRAWREEGASWLEKSATQHPEWARRIGPLLPESHPLDGARVMATYLWKWPTRVRTAGESSQFYVQRCVTKHFRDELAALRPRLLVTHDKEAAAWVAQEAEARGVTLRDPPAHLRSSEVGPWALPSEAWGWPMGLLLMRDAAEATYRPTAEKYAQAVVQRVLREFTPEPRSG